MTKNLVFIIVVFLSLVSCQNEETEFEKEQGKYISEMEWLLTADPNHDVEAAISREDFRFKGIYGYSISVPRVKITCLNFETDINPIKGTSDAVLGYEHARLIVIAREYANYYNMRMRIYLEKRHGFDCNS